LYKVLAIGDPDFCAGFALAGIETRPIEPVELEAALRAAMDAEDYALVIIDESQSELLESIQAEERQSLIPIVIPVPGKLHWVPHEDLGEDTYIAALIRRAVGYQLDIEL
jgi:vacuolar-type H+-ATPase subunit F/Vma7